MTFRSLFQRVSVCCVLLAAVAPHRLSAAPAQPDALFPSTTLPTVSSQAANEYYIDLLKWTRTITMGPVTAGVSYLDPPFYLAWLSQSDPAVTQATFGERFSGFPHILRFRVAFQAADRTDIHAKEWKLTLKGSAGSAMAAKEGHRIAPMDVESGPKGNYWEVDWDYTFAVPDGFLKTTKDLDVSLSGPAGSGRVVWMFGVQAAASADTGSYVTYLGSVLLLLCVLLLVALFVTRPPRASAI